MYRDLASAEDDLTLVRQPDVDIRAQRLAHVVAEDLAQGAATGVHPPHHLPSHGVTYHVTSRDMS